MCLRTEPPRKSPGYFSITLSGLPAQALSIGIKYLLDPTSHMLPAQDLFSVSGTSDHSDAIGVT